MDHNLPQNLKYTEMHNWVQPIEKDLLRVGITDFAQSELGDIVYVQLPQLEQYYNSGSECAALESVKSASDIYCPVSGTILKINEQLNEHPESINDDPYGAGWLFVLKLQDQTELTRLLDANKYHGMLNGI